TVLAEHLKNDVFPDLRVGLVHGQMPSYDKDEAMEQFRAGELDVLVATVVIEVGVDVANACCMIIEDAERFGLAQLHQLRGRVGRGEDQSYCVLLADPKNDEGRLRLEAMVETCDGFRIAEVDLKLRGPGEFYGTRQSGLLRLRIANITGDTEILELARREAFDLERFTAGQLEDLGVAGDVGDAQAQQAALPGAVEFPRSAQLQVHLGDAEAVARFDHRLQAEAAFIIFRVGEQHAVGLVLTASHAPAELVELRQAEPLGVLDDHAAGVRHVDADL